MWVDFLNKYALDICNSMGKSIFEKQIMALLQGIDGLEEKLSAMKTTEERDTYIYTHLVDRTLKAHRAIVYLFLCCVFIASFNIMLIAVDNPILTSTFLELVLLFISLVAIALGLLLTTFYASLTRLAIILNNKFSDERLSRFCSNVGKIGVSCVLVGALCTLYVVLLYSILGPSHITASLIFSMDIAFTINCILCCILGLLGIKEYLLKTYSDISKEVNEHE